MSLNTDKKGVLIAQSTDNEFIFLDEDINNELKDRDKTTEIKIDACITKERFLPVPYVHETDRECVLVVGKSGSGKSYFTCLYVMQYKKIFPKNQVFLFTKINEDPSFDAIAKHITRIDMDLFNIDEHGNLDLYANSLVIFDDIDQLYDVGKRAEIFKLRNAILEEGRKRKIYSVITKHQFPRTKDEKILSVECRSVVFFPSNNRAEIDHYLQKFMMLYKKKRSAILSIKSRWVMYVNNRVDYCVSDCMIKIIQ